METKVLYEKTMDRMLRLKYMLEIYEYLDDKTKVNYRDFEEEFEVENYPVHAPEMKSSIILLGEWAKTKNNRIFFKSEKIISSWDTTDEIVGNIIPYKKMFFLHYFILLEGFGNNIVKIINRSFFNKINSNGNSWHSRVNKYNKNINESIEKFKSIFDIKSLFFPNEFIELLLKVKETRNKIAHEDCYDKKHFHSDIESILILTSYLYFSITNDKNEIIMFPWRDSAEWMDV
jgi:hypothetical protein